MSDERTIEFDVAAVIGGNADSIVAKLSDLSDAQLNDLGLAETGQAKPRSTVLAAIDAERKGRAEAASQASSALVAAQDDAAAVLAVRIAELEKLVAERDQRIADLEGAIADRQAKAAAKVEKPVAMQVAADLPDLAGLEEVRVRCVDADDVTVPGLSPLLFMPWQFVLEGDGYVLDAPIAFPREAPESEVAALFLTIKGKSGLRAAFVQPVSVGGGKALELPRGHVKFVAAPMAAPIEAG